MQIVTPREVEEAYRISDEGFKRIIRETEIKLNQERYLVFKHENLKKIFPNIGENLESSIQKQRVINEIIWNIYNNFKEHAQNLEFVTDFVIIRSDVDSNEMSLYVFDEQITGMFCDSVVPMSNVPIGETGEQEIYFTGSRNGAKRLYNELEKWIAEQDIQPIIPEQRKNILP